jgi:ribosomal protein S6E (S10)
MSMQSHTHAASASAIGDHVHGAWTDAQGEHGHTAWTDTQGNHDHGWRIVATGQGLSIGHPVGGGSPVDLEFRSGVNSDNQPMRTDYQGNHAHNVGIGAAGLHGHNVGVGGAGNHTHTVTVTSTGGNETRPKNIALLFCIKY